MKKTTHKFSLLLIPVLAIIPSINQLYAAPAPIVVSTQKKSDEADHHFGLGATSSRAQRPFVGVDRQDAVLPYISLRYKKFYIEGIDFGFNLLQNESYNLDLLATPRFYEVKASFAASNELDGIDENKPTYFAGVSAQFYTDFATYTLQLLRDVAESDGIELVFAASKSFKPGNSFTLTPSLGLTIQDSELVGHFYGVQANEVRAGRPAYDGDTSVNYNVTLNAVWRATRHWEFLGQIKYEILGDGITDSPIVDDDELLFLTVGTVYRF